jgi:transposase-like protein
MGKRKHSPEWMLDRVLEYLSGNSTYTSISKANGISISTVRRWVLVYREYGPEAFLPKAGNTHYSKQLQIILC